MKRENLDPQLEQYRAEVLAEYFGADKIDILAVVGTLWAGRWFVISFTTLVSIIAVIITLMLPNIYRSEVLLAPASSNNMNNLSGLANKYGGLASLAGINLNSMGGGGVDKTLLTLKVLSSRAFLVDFIRKNNLVVPLMAAEGWDSVTQKWIIDPDIYNESTHTWVRDVSPPYKPEPSDLEVYDTFIEDVLTVSQDAKTSMVTVGVELLSPIYAQQWLTWLVDEVNQYMRERDIKSASESIAYLQAQMSTTSVAEMQQVFYQLIEEQTKSMMLAKVHEDYVLTIIDPPVVPEEKSSPKRAIICVVAFFVGLIISMLIVLVRASIKDRLSGKSQ